MKTKVIVYTRLCRVPTRYRSALQRLTLGNFGYMQEHARFQWHNNVALPAAVAYVDGWPAGWMIFDCDRQHKLMMYVGKRHRQLGLARRMAKAIRRKYPRRRLGVFPSPHAAKVIRGLAKPNAI